MSETRDVLPTDPRLFIDTVYRYNINFNDPDVKKRFVSYSQLVLFYDGFCSRR